MPERNIDADIRHMMGHEVVVLRSGAVIRKLMNMFISDAPNKDHPGTPRWWPLIFRRIVSAEHGLDLHRCHVGFLRQENAELAQRNHVHAP